MKRGDVRKEIDETREEDEERETVGPIHMEDSSRQNTCWDRTQEGGGMREIAPI